MNQQDHELISAFVDNEVDSNQGQPLLDRLAGNPDLKQQMSRYQMIGNVLRHEHQDIDIDIADAVHARLEDEPTVLAPRVRHRPTLGQVALGSALAASVAAIALTVAPQFLGQPGDTGEGQIAFVPKHLPQTVALDSRAMESKVKDKLSRYLLEHSEYSGRSGVNGPAPHVGFVSYDAR